MEEITLETGFSYYKDNKVSDIDICTLVGLQTYKALYVLFPEYWVAITYPMTASAHHLYRVKILLSLQDNITGDYLKKKLVMRFIDGPIGGASELIADLANSSESLQMPDMSPFSYTIWIIWMTLMMIFTVIILYIYVWPDYNSCYKTCGSVSLGINSVLNSCNIPIPVLV
jgi:hypothetical protein